MKNKRQMFFSLIMVLSLLFSSFGAIHVYADDATPTSQATEESLSVEETPEAQATEEAAANPTEAPGETAVDGASEATPEATEGASDPINEPVAQTGDEGPVEPSGESQTTQEATAQAQVTQEPAEGTEPTGEPTPEPAPMLSDEELDTVPEILENVPDETELVVLNENGEPESMASEKASQTLIEGDPIWCPGTQAPTPGANGCTIAYATLAELLSALETDGGTNYAGAGTIYVADSYSGNDDNAIEINGNNLPQFASNDLTIQGGWDDGTGMGGQGTADLSDFDVSLTIINWLGDITLNDLVFHDVSNEGGVALTVDTQGSVTLVTIKVYSSTNNTNGAEINGTAGVTIQNSSNFSGNEGYGLIARSTGGNISLTSFSANHNELTGAYLDTCNWHAAAQTCTGSGDVTVNGITANENLQNGMQIDAGGSSEIRNINVVNNSLSGLLLTNGTQGSADTILISGGSFEENAGGSGLIVTQYGDGEVYLNSFGAYNNQSGIITNSFGSGDVIFSSLTANENAQTGLHAEANGDIKLSGFRFSENENYGAYLISNGNISVENGTFDLNANNETSEFAGLYAKAVGNISLQDMVSDLNYDGAGAFLKSTGSGNIGIKNSFFRNNSLYGINATTNDGNITSNNVNVSTNDDKGSILKVLGNGNISIFNGSVFSQNANHEIYASVENGNIELEDISIGSLFTSGSKVELINNSTGTVTVIGATFNKFSNSGLTIVANGIVTLNNSIFTNNTNHGVEVYSTYTAKQCYCPENEVTYVTVNVNGGGFGGNGQYGIYVKSDDENALTLSGTELFLPNGDSDYFVDTSEIPLCENCGCSTEGNPVDKPAEKPDGKSYQIVDVPFSGSGNVPQDCSTYAGTLLQMEDGTFVKVACPFEGLSNLKGISENELPGELGSKLDIGILLDLIGDDGSVIINSDGTITLTFTIPENSRGRTHQLLYWDSSMNDGAGGWIEMPPYEAGGSSMLHPENQDDPRMIVSGVVNNGTTMSVMVNFGGYFAMVAN